MIFVVRAIEEVYANVAGVSFEGPHTHWVELPVLSAFQEVGKSWKTNEKNVENISYKNCRFVYVQQLNC